MTYWLVKTEPSVYSIDDLKRDKITPWDGVRNYQARNNLLAMKRGDLVFVYHSQIDPPGIVGLATVIEEATPDELQFDRKSPYFDPKATKEKPRWFAPKLKFKKRFPEIITLNQLKAKAELKNMQLLQRGNRLSVLPVSNQEFTFIESIYHSH